MSPRRQWLLAGLLAGAWAPGRAAARANDSAAGAENAGNAEYAEADRIHPDRRLAFPRDHGAHPGARIEWWYATGWLHGPGDALFGFQLTFFRSRTGVAESLPGRFAPRQ